MEIQASRCARASGRPASPCCCSTRTARAGTGCSSRAGWRRSSAREAARRARSGPTRCRRPSPPATPARARPPTTDWERIVALYDALAQRRAVAGRRAQPRRGRRDGVGPAAGLELVDALAGEPALRDYHLLPSVRGDLLEQARPLRRGARGVRARGRAHAQRARAATAARPRRRLRLERGDEDRA